jgi:hypothetical protein
MSGYDFRKGHEFAPPRWAKNIIQKQVTDEEWKEYALATVALFVEARITRNNLIHSLPKFRPTFDPESLLSSVGHKRSAKGGSGTIKTTEYDRSATALNEFVTILMHLGLALQTAEIRLRDFVSPGQISRTFFVDRRFRSGIGV